MGYIASRSYVSAISRPKGWATLPDFIVHPNPPSKHTAGVERQSSKSQGSRHIDVFGSVGRGYDR